MGLFSMSKSSHLNRLLTEHAFDDGPNVDRVREFAALDGDVELPFQPGERFVQLPISGDGVAEPDGSAGHLHHAPLLLLDGGALDGHTPCLCVALYFTSVRARLTGLRLR